MNELEKKELLKRTELRIEKFEKKADKMTTRIDICLYLLYEHRKNLVDQGLKNK